MPAGAWSRLGKWRTFADGVALVLGINVWVSVVLLPGSFVNAWADSAALTAALVPLPVLMLGLWRRSEAILLAGFPSALLLPVALVPEMASAHVYGLLRFSIVAVGLVAYLMSASFFTSFHEPPPPTSVRPLSSSRQPVPPRWRRRFRIYLELTILAVVCPLALIYFANFHHTNQAFLRTMFPGRVASMTTMLDLLVIALWLVLYSYVFLGVLKPHRTGDRDLAGQLSRLRADARRGRPRPAFYVAMAVALGLMAILLWSRYF